MQLPQLPLQYIKVQNFNKITKYHNYSFGTIENHHFQLMNKNVYFVVKLHSKLTMISFNVYNDTF